MSGSTLGPGGYRRSSQNEPEPDSLRTKAEEAGVHESTLRYRMKQGMTLDEAMTVVKQRGGKKKPPIGLGHSGGKSEDKESFHQYFVDTLRRFYGLAPLYRQEKK